MKTIMTSDLKSDKFSSYHPDPIVISRLLKNFMYIPIETSYNIKAITMIAA